MTVPPESVVCPEPAHVWRRYQEAPPAGVVHASLWPRPPVAWYCQRCRTVRAGSTIGPFHVEHSDGALAAIVKAREAVLRMLGFPEARLPELAAIRPPAGPQVLAVASDDDPLTLF